MKHKEYLIGIVLRDKGSSVVTSIYGDSCRPFPIAGNLWNYTTPWHAARRLELLARSWEKLGYSVHRIHGTIHDMPTKGDPHNVYATIRDFS